MLLRKLLSAFIRRKAVHVEYHCHQFSNTSRQEESRAKRRNQSPTMALARTGTPWPLRHCFNCTEKVFRGILSLCKPSTTKRYCLRFGNVWLLHSPSFSLWMVCKILLVLPFFGLCSLFLLSLIPSFLYPPSPLALRPRTLRRPSLSFFFLSSFFSHPSL